MPRSRFLILGAGPTGLGAARRLLDLGESNFLILEGSRQPGGLASSERDAGGFTWDLGSHLFYSHYDKVDRDVGLALADHQWLHHQRSTWIWIRDGFVPYPFQLNLRHLSPTDRWDCVRGLLRARRDSHRKKGSFRDWILGTFGEGIAQQFLLPYNEKAWGYPLERMASGWIAERVAVPDLEEVLRGICLEEDTLGWGPNATFRYPLCGGAGAVWSGLAKTLPSQCIRYGERVVAIDANRRVVSTDTGSQCGYEYLISTIPVDQLTAMMRWQPPLPVAEPLASTTTHVVGVGLEGHAPECLREKLWIYYAEDPVPFYRVTMMSNLSPENTPHPGATWSLMAEMSASDFRPVPSGDLVQKAIEGLRFVGLIREKDRIISRWHRRLSHGYPVPTINRDEILASLLPRLRDLGIYSRGRFGAWKYEVGNQDHSFMQGVEAVENIVRGHPELTIENPDLVNSRCNPFPYPEWSGS